MKTIDLHQFYPEEPKNSFVDLPDEIADALLSTAEDIEAARRLTVQIDLHRYYPHEPAGTFREVPVRIAIELLIQERKEEAGRRKVYWNKAFYSLDAGDGIEAGALLAALSPYELVEESLTMDALYAALDKLPEIQARRIRSFYFDDMSKAAIAAMEGVDERVVRLSISKGIENLKKILKDWI